MTNDNGQPLCQMERINGLTLRVARWRQGMGKSPLLFLNGIGADIAAATPLLSSLQGREVWTVDMPGTGGSPDTLLPYALQDMARALIGLADRYGHETLDVAGFSWGGVLAQQVAAQFSERVHRLILMATAPAMTAATIGWTALWDADMIARGWASPAATPFGMAYQNLALTMAGWSNEGTGRARHGAPTLILMGDQDGIVPVSHGTQLAEMIDNSRLEIIAGSHLFPFTRTAETARLVTEFLSSPASRADAPFMAACG